MSKLNAAVRWIAENDEPTELDPFVIAEQISVLLVADVWGKDPGEIAMGVVNFRFSRG
jgi:hypothetical protein